MSSTWTKNNEHRNVDDEHSNLSNSSDTTSSSPNNQQQTQQTSIYSESTTLKNLQEHESGPYIRSDLPSYTDPIVYYGDGLIDPLQQNYSHLQQVLYSSPISALPHLSYDEATRARTIVYDNSTFQAWPSNEPQHFLPYPSNDLATHQTDQVHVWQDSTTGGTYIQYLDGSCFDPTDARECVSCGNISTSLMRHELSDHYICSTCRLRHSPNRSLPRLTRHLEEEEYPRSSTMETSYASKTLSNLVLGNTDRPYATIKSTETTKSTPTITNKQTVTTSRRTGLQCANCQTQTTTLWRRNSEGEPVCNACGLYFKLHHVHRPMNMVKEGIQTRRRKQRNNNGNITPKTKPTKSTMKSSTSESNHLHDSMARIEEYPPRQDNYQYGDLYPPHVHLVHHHHHPFEQAQRFISQQQLEMTGHGFDAELCARDLVTSPIEKSEEQHLNVIKIVNNHQA